MFQAIQKFFKSITRQAYQGTVDGWKHLLRYPNDGEVYVDRLSIFGIPAVWNSINLISNVMATTPLPVYRTGDNNSREKFYKHRAYKLLNAEANDNQTSFALKKQIAVDLCWAGNAYIYDDVSALYRLDPDKMAAKIEFNQFRPLVTYYHNSEYVPSDRLIHIKGMSNDGLFGMRLTDVCRRALGLPLSAMDYANNYFEYGGVRYWIQIPTSFKDKEAVETYKASYVEQLRNNKSFIPPIFQTGSSLNAIQNSNESAQLEAMLSSSRIDISLLFSLPPSKNGSTINTSYSSLSSEEAAMLRQCFNPWFANIESELTRGLIKESEKPDVYIEYLRAALLQGDPDAESNRIINELNNGLLSWSEARSLRNYSTEKLDAQEWRHPSAVVIEGELPPNAPAPATPPQAPVEEPQQQQEQPAKRSSDAANAIARAAVERLINRLANDTTGYMNRHKDVFAEALPDVDLSNWWNELESEFEFTLPEQRKELLNTKYTEALWNVVLRTLS